MSDSFLELAVSLQTNTLTLFIGTGFSKYITDGKAPSWLELIIGLVDRIDVAGSLSSKLLNTDGDGIRSAKFELYVMAQILELEYRKKGRDIRYEAAQVVADLVNPKTINTKKLALLRSFFKDHSQLNFVTTNYDTLISDFLLGGLGACLSRVQRYRRLVRAATCFISMAASPNRTQSSLRSAIITAFSTKITICRGSSSPYCRKRRS